jgi:hypothetical protein
MSVEPNSSRGWSVVWTFSLKQLFVWTAVVGLGCVALRNASDVWAAAMLGLVVLVLASAILLAIFRSEARRAFWIGFATFGWLYVLLLAFGWSLDPNNGPDNPLRPHNLVTTRISNACYHWLYDAAFARYYSAQQSSMGGMSGGMMGSGMGGLGPMTGYGSGMMPGSGSMPLLTAPPGPAQHEFANVAHSLWAILLATLGGCLASWLYATKREPTRE